MFGCLFQMRYLNKIFKLDDFVVKVLHTDISGGIPCLFIFCRTCFGLEIQSGYQPISWSFLFYFWLLRCGFHLVQIVKFLWYFQNLVRVQSDTVITILDLSMFPNIALTIVSHVHRDKQILLLTIELFLPELKVKMEGWGKWWVSFPNEVPEQIFQTLWFFWKGPSYRHSWWNTLSFYIF